MTLRLTLPSSRKTTLYVVLHVCCVVGFFVAMMGFHHPGLGFTSMIHFGTEFEARSLHEVRELPRYFHRGVGYDGQFYAQLAVRPFPWDPELQRALDNPWFRAERILPSLIACGFAFGSAAWAVHLYAVQYLVVWGLFALVLLLWFPVGTLWNFCCWSGCLFSAGTVMATCRALPDAWTALLIAAGTYLWAERRSRWGVALLGLAGLAKETAIFAATAFVERVPASMRDFFRMASNVFIVIAPALGWFLVIRMLGGSFAVDNGTFELPFAGLLDRALAVGDGPIEHILPKLSVIMSSVVQAAFFLFWWRPGDWRWRIGIVHVAFMAMLGAPVWEGHPIAAGRVLSPLLLMFNLSVPQNPRFWPLLLAGNLSVISGFDILGEPPAR